MKLMFSVHAGEYLTGSHIEKRFRNVHLWVPAKDTGIDLLVSDRANRQTVSLQVKLSKDYLVTDMQRRGPEFQQKLRACGWWTPNKEKLSRSPADYWVLVLLGFANMSVDYVVIPPKELARRLPDIHPEQREQKIWQVYVWVTKTGGCWETRHLSKSDEFRVIRDEFTDPHRDFREYLNVWGRVECLDDGSAGGTKLV
ncbi:MAG: hypothetical protein WAR21_05345 [Candidatus Acidiferrales bacterium]